MTDNRTIELLPCPFCGGDAEFHIYNTICLVECSRCRIGTTYHLIEEYENVITQWNARVYMKCDVEKGTGNVSGWWVCKSCGCAFDQIGALAARGKKKPNYCPNCRRRVNQ